jgi:hypothetical protein
MATTSTTTTSTTNHAPVVTGCPTSVKAGGSVSASSLIYKVTDQDNDAIVSYKFTTNGLDGGYFTLNGVKQSNTVTVSAADLSKLSYVAGTKTISQQVTIQAYDGKAWSSAAQATLCTDIQAPTTTSTVPLTAAQTSAVNTLVNSLTDAGIKSDVSKALSDGTISFSEMITILTDTEPYGMSTNEVNDLKTLVSSCKTNNFTSSYVYDITNKLVNGDTANSSFVGGTATKLPTANLKANYTSAQVMDLLVQKWFYGNDMPYAGSCNSGASYAVNSTSLYGASGQASVNDVNEYRGGDCYLMAALGSMAAVDPSSVNSMIVDNGNQTYGVRFYVNGKETWVTVNSALPTDTTGKLVFNQSSALWADLIEKAYAQLASEGVLGSWRSTDNSYTSITGGSASVITELTGKNIVGYNSGTYNHTALQDYNFSDWMTLKDEFIEAVKSGREITISCTKDASSNGKSTFIANHSYSVVGYDEATGNFILRNPWGDSSTGSQTWNTTFEASMTDIYNNGGYVAVASATRNGVVNGNSAPVVTASSLVSVGNGQVTALSSLFSVKDTNGDTMSQYLFKDGSGYGSISLNGATNLATTEEKAQGIVRVASSDLSKLTYVGGSAGLEQLSISAYDGNDWSTYKKVYMNNTGATVTSSTSTKSANTVLSQPVSYKNTTGLSGSSSTGSVASYNKTNQGLLAAAG